jgi:hypothetical protein
MRNAELKIKGVEFGLRPIGAYAYAPVGSGNEEKRD